MTASLPRTAASLPRGVSDAADAGPADARSGNQAPPPASATTPAAGHAAATTSASASATDDRTRLRLAIESTQAGTHERDLLTDEATWCPRLREIYDIADDERPTTGTWLSRIHRDDRAQVLQAQSAALDPTGSGHYRATFRVVRRDGSVRWVEGSGQVVFETRRGVRTPVRLAGLTFDVTDRIETLAALRDADRRKDEFLAMLAHELRNPLAPLVTAHEVLARSAALTEPERAALAIARRQATQLGRLVDDLLEVSRITRGMIALRLEPMGLASAVREAAEAVAPAIDARRQSLVVSVPSRPLRIVADAARIAQVLENLLNNASKFTPEGGAIRIEVEACGDEVELRVVDSGVGIAPGQLGAIFDLFTQADPTTDRAQGGLGIGLALVRRLVALHGGWVGAASAGLGRGATFTVRLPRSGPGG